MGPASGCGPGLAEAARPIVTRVHRQRAARYERGNQAASVGFAANIIWGSTGPGRHRVIEESPLLRSDPAVNQGAPRCHDKGYQVGQWHLPDQAGAPAVMEQEVCLIDGDQNRPDQKGDQERPPQHRTMPDRAAPAFEHHPVRRSELKHAAAPQRAGAVSALSHAHPPRTRGLKSGSS